MPKTRRAAALAFSLLSCGAQAQTPIPPSPKDFVMASEQSDQYEILAATTAEAETQDPRVRAFAQEMIQDHTRLAEALRRAAAVAGLPSSEPSLSREGASLLGALQSLQGKDFDAAYAHQQELAHAQALAVEESFAAAGSDPDLRQAAQSALPTIRDHLKMAEQLRVAVGAS